MKSLAFSVATALVAFLAFGAPTVSNVGISQDSASKKVTITYDLDEEAIVTANILVGGAPLPAPANLAGDVNRVVAAGTARKIVWNPNLDWPLHSAADVSATLSAWTKDVPPDYMAVKLFDDAVGVKRWYYASTNDIPGGVTNRLYKSDYLLMRRIPAKGIKSRLGNDSTRAIVAPGSQTHLVSFTNDWYMAVYEFTEAQYAHVGGSRVKGPCFIETTPEEEHPYLPMTGVYYADNIRGVGATAQEPTDGSIIGRLRTRTGIATFDLPTDAQWEFSCRAKTATTLNDGTDTAWTGAGVENMKRVAWCKQNADGRPHEVGTRAPNAWGLYDMLGNATEWTRDKFHAYSDSDDDVDPVVLVGDSGKNSFLRRGGSYKLDGYDVNSGSRNMMHGGWSGEGNGNWVDYGFRVMCAVDE